MLELLIEHPSVGGSCSLRVCLRESPALKITMPKTEPTAKAGRRHVGEDRSVAATRGRRLLIVTRAAQEVDWSLYAAMSLRRYVAAPPCRYAAMSLRRYVSLSLRPCAARCARACVMAARFAYEIGYV